MDEATETRAADFWTRMRRRKVVQWGLVYAAAGWGFLQGLEYVSEAFGWPGQIRQIAILALVIGLPIVLILAWYHGDRGQRRVSGPEFSMLVGFLLLGGGIFWWHQRADHASSTTQVTGAAVPSATTDPRPAIAVLPFENRSRLEDDAFFVDGIHDDILTQLSRVSGLRVISRTSVERFRKTELSVQQIAQQLGVTNILEGGVQRAGDRVRINVQLIDAHRDSHHWAETYDRELTASNIFAIQSELAQAIAGALKTALTPDEHARANTVPTRNLQAWESYQLGKQRMAHRTSASLADAEQFFRKGIELDPKFALAYVGLADTLILQIDYSGAPQQPALEEARKSVAEALELEPDLAEAWASSAILLNDGRHDDQIEPMFRRSIELNPNYAQARHWYNIWLRNVGRFEEAFTQIEHALRLDPLSPIVNENVGETLEVLGRFQEAEASYRKAVTIDPSRAVGYAELSLLNAYALNRFADAISLMLEAIERDPGNPTYRSTIAELYLNLGEPRKAIETIAQAAERWPDAVTVQFSSAWILAQTDPASASRHAQRVIDALPRIWVALTILRNSYLEANNYSAAVERYRESYPELFGPGAPRVDRSNYGAAVDVALILQRRGDAEGARALLDGAENAVRTVARLGLYGHGIADVQIHALRGDKGHAVAALREAAAAGWRWQWQYHRDVDPNLASIRSEPEFKAIFADIERDMTRQRASRGAAESLEPVG